MFLLILCSIKIERLLFLKFLKILAFFDGYFWPFNKSEEKIKVIFVISVIWNVFIKFHWHDEKLKLQRANLYLLSPIFSDLMSANISDVYNFFRIWKKFLDTLIDDATIFWGKRSEFLSCLSFLQDTFLYSLRDITTSSKHSAGFFWSNLCTKPIQRFINCVKAVIHAVDCSFNNSIWITAKTKV